MSLELRIYKNWKEICEVMDWKTIGGTYKKARLKELETLCKYHKEANKFVIDEIYTEAKEKVDNRKNNGNNGHSTSKFSEIEKLIRTNLIMKYYNDSNTVVHLTAGQLVAGNRNNNVDDVQLYTIDYVLWKRKKNLLADTMKIDIDTVMDFYSTVDVTIKGYIKTALNNMDGIEWSYGYVVDDGTDINEADEEELKAIEEEEQNVLDELNCTNIQQVMMNRKKANKYYMLLNEGFESNRVLCKYKAIYKAYTIRFNDNFDKDDDISCEELEEYTKSYKDKIYNTLTNKFKRIHYKAIEKNTQYRINRLRMSYKYLEDIDRLINMLVLNNLPDDYWDINAIIENEKDDIDEEYLDIEDRKDDIVLICGFTKAD